jgi:hypothetical protein
MNNEHFVQFTIDILEEFVRKDMNMVFRGLGRSTCFCNLGPGGILLLSGILFFGTCKRREEREKNNKNSGQQVASAGARTSF